MNALTSSTIRTRIRAAAEQLTASERKIANAILADYPFTGLESIQELAASRQLGTIHSAVEGSGPDHARTFEAVLNIGGTPYGRGSGHSKKEAEQEAAADAWRALNSLDTASTEPASS